MENTQELINSDEEFQEEESSNEDPLGLDNMFGQQGKDSGLMEMPSLDLGLGF